jgi:hypothetical protein
LGLREFTAAIEFAPLLSVKTLSLLINMVSVPVVLLAMLLALAQHCFGSDAARSASVSYKLAQHASSQMSCISQKS